MPFRPDRTWVHFSGLIRGLWHRRILLHNRIVLLRPLRRRMSGRHRSVPVRPARASAYRVGRARGAQTCRVVCSVPIVILSWTWLFLLDTGTMRHVSVKRRPYNVNNLGRALLWKTPAVLARLLMMVNNVFCLLLIIDRCVNVCAIRRRVCSLWLVATGSCRNVMLVLWVVSVVLLVLDSTRVNASCKDVVRTGSGVSLVVFMVVCNLLMVVRVL